MSAAIVVQGLGKRSARYHADRPTTLKGTLAQGLRRIKPVERFGLCVIEFRSDLADAWSE